MRLSPSIFTFAQPLATVRFSQSVDDWAADKVTEIAGTGMPAETTSAGFTKSDTGQDMGQYTSGSLDQVNDSCHSKNQAARNYTQRTLEKTSPEMPESLTNERRTRFT